MRYSKPPLTHRLAARGAFHLVGDYDVFFGTRQSGRVQVRRQGLYYRFTCRCRLSGEVVCRLYVSCGGKRENLGVLVPMDGGFGLDTQIPVKRLGEGEPVFTLIPKHNSPSGRFVPIVPEEPFAYIERLKTSFLVRKYGQMGILIEDEPDQKAISSPTGQWSEPVTSE